MNRLTHWAGCLLLALAPVAFTLAHASVSVSYQLDTSNVQSGQTLSIKGLALNERAQAARWEPAGTLPVRWQDSTGRVTSINATLLDAPETVSIAPGGFAVRYWTLTTPEQSAGLQTLAVDTQPTLLAVHAGAPSEPALALQGNVGTAPATATAIVQSSGAPSAENSPFETFRRAISPYEPIYFDAGIHEGADARFQVSFKYRLFSPDDAAHPAWYDHLYLGYTQTSLWDLEGTSKPFVDSTYNPSAFWHNPKLLSGPDPQWVGGLALGAEHKSNGKSGPDSRSLNDFFIQPELNYAFDGGSVLTFMPRAKAYFSKDENPDYADYAGHVDWKLRWAQPNGLTLTGLYRQGKHGRTATQLEAAWPLQRTFLKMNGFFHVQYFKGYGETLLGYREKSDGQIRVGIALVP